jgi:nickel/cobalt transporter (NicO) family protein
VVLLGAIALGRTFFGVALVVGYGLGMAATLTAAGLLLIRVRDSLRGRSFDRLARPFARVAPYVPLATAALVVVVGVGLILRSAAGTV